MTAMGARTRRGFTLIELLTVTGIAIVLATLIVTALFTAQEAARNSTCRSNLAQSHKLMIMYTQSYGQFLPAFWHERWIGELGLAGGAWRADLQLLKRQSFYKNVHSGKDMDETWFAFLDAGGKTFPPAISGTGSTYWNAIRNRMLAIFNGTYGRLVNLDDVNPLMPNVWNNYQPPGYYLGGVERPVARTSAPFIMCPSDASNYRCDQGGLVSYMGLAKYGWWHRGGTNTESRYYEYHQIQEVTNPSQGLLLAETEPGTWQAGNCG
ncbi:MAG TPA: hypothetical protein VNE39_03490 [Planctomycetota bacterium]|nr:hypothetical protein [Planctomycetota bacterium]